MSQPVKRRETTPLADTRGEKSQRISLDAAKHSNSTKASGGMADDSEDEFQYDDDLDDSEDEVIVEGDDMNDDEEDGEDKQKQEDQEQPRVWRHGLDKLAEDEVLQHDPAAYKVYETLQLEWPALSFDILKDPKYSDYSTTYPVTIFAVCGTQTANGAENKVNVVLMENINESKNLEDDDGAINLDGNDDDENDDQSLEPLLTTQAFIHPGCVNKIRAMPQNQQIVSTMSENGHLYVWDVSSQIAYLSKNLITPPSMDLKPVYKFNHGVEGYGMAWSSVKNALATGDRNGNIFLHNILPDGSAYSTMNSESPYSTQVANNWIECIEWSPSEANVFATVDTTGHLSVWHDQQPRPKISIKAHDAEINAVSWNKHTNYLLATGDDNGVIKIWDLRYIADPVRSIQASYSWHKKAITALNWHPHESSMFVASGEDDSITVWDLSLEADIDEVAKEATGAQMIDYNVPGQLLFQHLGQKEVKDVQFHPQFPSLVLSTASIGIDIFRPANLDVVLSNPNEPTEKIVVD